LIGVCQNQAAATRRQKKGKAAFVFRGLTHPDKNDSRHGETKHDETLYGRKFFAAQWSGGAAVP
jgi:hypothetical protein